MSNWRLVNTLIIVFACLVLAIPASAAAPQDGKDIDFPRDLQSYDDGGIESIAGRLVARAKAQPFNVAASLIFFLAIVHTFLSSKFMAIALVAAIIVFFDWATAKYYLSHRVNFTEPLFVVVIMTLAATRPILRLSELLMKKIANRLGGSLTDWWFTILIFGPILGSFITEPAAMTISAILLGKKFYELAPPENFKYATLGLLFVNISVGGPLTHFAAPPVLMVASPWN